MTSLSSSKMATTSSRERLLRESLDYAAEKLRIPSGKFRDLQESAIRSVIDDGRDIFVALPTGFGKSAIYQAIPLCYDYLRDNGFYAGDVSSRWHTTSDRSSSTRHSTGTTTSQTTRSRSVCVVISPLISLMRSQVTHLKSLGISAVYVNDVLSGSPDDRELINGGISIVYMSPESVLGKRGNELLMSTEWQQNLCALVVDESHCITKWGQNSKKVAAFRTRYGRLAETRSVVPPSIPMASLTATASVCMKTKIIDSLSLTNPIIVEKSPDRGNIRYSVMSVKSSETPKIFRSLREELELKKSTLDRTIVFCRTHRQCRELYEYFKSGVKDTASFAMYHSTTDQPQKDRVLASFAETGGVVRVLFATVAFGMGVDCKGLTRIYHYGPPEDIEDYVQETGRAGRGGEESDVVLINYRGCTQYKVHEAMKQYMGNNDACRRSVLLSPFGGDIVAPSIEKHRCCDICAKLCECGGEGCKKEVFEYVESEKKMLHELQQCQNVTQEQKDELLKRLDALRGSVVAGSSAELLAGCDLSSGIPLSELNSFVANCDRMNSFDMFTAYFQFFGHEEKIWEIFVSVSQEHCEIEKFSYSDSLSSESEEECLENLRGVFVFSESD